MFGKDMAKDIRAKHENLESCLTRKSRFKSYPSIAID
jgi:hypothetical protein